MNGKETMREVNALIASGTLQTDDAIRIILSTISDIQRSIEELKEATVAAGAVEHADRSRRDDAMSVTIDMMDRRIKALEDESRIYPSLTRLLHTSFLRTVLAIVALPLSVTVATAYLVSLLIEAQPTEANSLLMVSALFSVPIVLLAVVYLTYPRKHGGQINPPR